MAAEVDGYGVEGAPAGAGSAMPASYQAWQQAPNQPAYQQAPVYQQAPSQPIYQQMPAQQAAPGFIDQTSYAHPQTSHVMNGGVVDGVTAAAQGNFDYGYINNPARIAVYDSLKTAPMVIQVQGGPTHEYIERIATLTYQNARDAGGSIPYTVIREVSENFIHAQFAEVVVSIFDRGNTIRFADQGPGIQNKDLVQEPGFTSAIEPMKRYIRGVGSGLPIVKDYLSTTHGRIKIEDNVNQGSVITISMLPEDEATTAEAPVTQPNLTKNEKKILVMLHNNAGQATVTETHNETGVALSSIHTAFRKLEAAGLVTKVDKVRQLTNAGESVARTLL